MKKELFQKIVLITIITTTLLIIGISVLVYYHSVINFDVYFSKEIQSEGDSFIESFFIFYILKGVSFLGTPLIAFLLAIGFSSFFLILKYRRESFFCLFTSLAVPITYFLKIIINRPRPSQNYISIFDYQSSPSFPSTHVVLFTVFFGFIIATMFFVKKIPSILRFFVGLFSLVLIILVSISRVYLGAHWTTDVIGGYLLGFLLLSVLLYFYLKPCINKKLRFIK